METTQPQPTLNTQPHPRGGTPTTSTEPPNPHQHWTSPTRISSVTKRTFSTLRDVEQFHDVEFANESSSKIFRPWTWKPQRISSWIRNRRRQIWNWRGLNPIFLHFFLYQALKKHRFGLFLFSNSCIEINDWIINLFLSLVQIKSGAKLLKSSGKYDHKRHQT